MAEKTDHINVQLVSARNFPVGTGRVPLDFVRDSDRLYELWREAKPALSYDQFVRYVWVKGLDSLRGAIRTGTIPDPDRLPLPRAMSSGG